MQRGRMNATLLVAIFICVSFCVTSVASIGNVGVDISINGPSSNATAASALDCASKCDLAASCVAWSWNSCGSSRCTLLTATGALILPASCSVSSAKLGQVGVDRQSTAISGYYPYNLASGSTAVHCANLCSTTTSCVMWSFEVATQKCYLMSAISNTKITNSGRTSGVQGTNKLNSPYNVGLDTIILSANASATQCSDLCSATPGCKVWLYQPPSSACGKTYASFCWAKPSLFMNTGVQDACYVVGQQPLSTAVAPVSTAITPASIVATAPSSTFPFNKIVAFGDNLSDNGNGSYAHCLADRAHCNNVIYGSRTWTDGPVAVSFLSTYLKAPLVVDYAFGHADGGSKFGATIDNTYTQSQAGVPSAKDQIVNYTTTGPQSRDTTLHFLWIGANDINLYHIDTNSANNSKFATQFSALMVQRVHELINGGAKYIFVVNLYPKQLSPSSQFYAYSPTQIANFGSAINQANTAISAALASFGANVIYYDVNKFMTKLWQKHDSYGISHVYKNEFCDGYNQINWELCVTDKLGSRFYWMQYTDMTSPTHNLIAADMYVALATRFAK